MNELKLFVWQDCLVDFDSGVMFALAADADGARALLRACDDDSLVDEALAKWGGG